VLEIKTCKVDKIEQRLPEGLKFYGGVKRDINGIYTRDFRKINACYGDNHLLRG
jgi:hypothetical protein